MLQSQTPGRPDKTPGRANPLGGPRIKPGRVRVNLGCVRDDSPGLGALADAVRVESRRVPHTGGARCVPFPGRAGFPQPASWMQKEGAFSNPPLGAPPREGARRSAFTLNCFISALGEPRSMGGPRGLLPTDTVRKNAIALVFVYFVHFVVPQTSRCGPVACGDDAACLLPTVRARKPCEVLQRRAGVEPRNTRKPEPTAQCNGCGMAHFVGEVPMRPIPWDRARPRAHPSCPSHAPRRPGTAALPGDRVPVVGRLPSTGVLNAKRRAGFPTRRLQPPPPNPPITAPSDPVPLPFQGWMPRPLLFPFIAVEPRRCVPGHGLMVVPPIHEPSQPP